MALIAVIYNIFEEFMLVRDLVVAFNVIDHLHEVMGQAFKVYLARDRTPTEVEMPLSLVGQFDPSF